MTPSTLDDWLEDRDPRVAITIAFRVAARFWPLPRWSGHVDSAGVASARALLIAECIARAPEKNAIRSMKEGALKGAATAVRKTGASKVNPLEPEAVGFWELNSALPTISEVVLPVLGSGRDAKYASTLASLAMLVAVTDVGRNEAVASIPGLVGRMARYSSEMPRHLGTDMDTMETKGAIDDALRADCKCIEEFGPEALWTKPLWPNGQNPLQKRWDNARSAMLRGSHFDFPRRWYERLLIGEPVHQGILSEIANMPPQDWDQGPGHIAERIAEIELHHIRLATPLAERVEWVPEIERIRITPTPMGDASTWNVILDKLRDALRDIRPEGTLRNAHAALQDTVTMLERTLGAYSDSPQRVHDDMEIARSELRLLVKAGEIPDDMRVQRFIRVLDSNILDIQGSVPSVLEAVSSRAALRLRRLSEDELKTLTEITTAVVPLLEEERHQQEMEEDFTALGDLDPRTPGIKTGIYRWASRMSRILQDAKVLTVIARTGEEIFVLVAAAYLIGVLAL